MSLAADCNSLCGDSIIRCVDCGITRDRTCAFADAERVNRNDRPAEDRSDRTRTLQSTSLFTAGRRQGLSSGPTAPNV